MKTERFRELLGNRADVLSAYEQTRERTPQDTIELLIAMRGEEQMQIDIAECVNATCYDGRLSEKVKSWAKQINGAASREELNANDIYSITSYMHPAHLQQIAEIAMKR